MIIAGLFVGKIDRPGKMKPVCDHNSGMTILHFDDNWFGVA